MKKAFTFLFALLLTLLIPSNTFASTGNPNIDGGGGGMGQGTSTNSWTPGNDGVRVTIVDSTNNQVASKAIDFSNKPPANIAVHFRKISKIQYRSGTLITPTSETYTFIKPTQSMPKIISSTGSNNIQAIRNYFCRVGTLQDIAKATGFDFDLLVSGKYKILLEPIAYFKYQGIMYAMTATEAALFDQKVSGGLRSKMVSLSHKNLPLAMFLEFDELGFSAWHGSTTTPASNENIIKFLGMGVIRFKELEIVEQKAEVIYRTDTEVFTSISLTTGKQKTPANPAYAIFSINGQTYSHTNIYIPEGNSQLAWAKWRTPPQPGTVTITIKSNCSLDTNIIIAEIVNLDENVPPDPQANDRNDGFQIPSVPSKANVATLAWGEWDCWWHEYWVWYSGDEDEDGWWEDHGWYEYEWIPYTATLSATTTLKPDEKSPTATATTIKSGYGLNMNVSSEIRSYAPSSHVTGAQNVVSYFPEFEYKTYWRLLARVNTGLRSTFEFQKNSFSTYNRPVHFSPIYFMDGYYTVYAEIMDAWTPAGMLQINTSPSLTIRGNLFSDWHVRPTN